MMYIIYKEPIDLFYDSFNQFHHDFHNSTLFILRFDMSELLLSKWKFDQLSSNVIGKDNLMSDC